MKITGIIVEYNPLHLGHLHHIKEAKRLTQCDVLVAVMSPHFTQRGEIACVDKFERTLKALEHGVDVVIEIPTVYAVQSASIFAKTAVQLLRLAKVDTIVFGSETNDITTLTEIAKLPVNIDYFKEKMAQGYSYPQALSLSSEQLYPNDILGVAYIREAIKEKIKTVSIQRTNHYHDVNLNQDILSASAIRMARHHNIETNQALVSLINYVHYDAIYPFLRYSLLSRSARELKQLFLVSEGIENLLKEKALQQDDYDGFLAACTSRRYSRSRIQRICIHILLNHSKEMVNQLKPLNHLRILGFNQKITDYLKLLSNVCTKVSDLPDEYWEIEFNATSIYQLLSAGNNLIQKEIGKIIII